MFDILTPNNNEKELVDKAIGLDTGTIKEADLGSLKKELDTWEQLSDEALENFEKKYLKIK